MAARRPPSILLATLAAGLSLTAGAQGVTPPDPQAGPTAPRVVNPSPHANASASGSAQPDNGPAPATPPAGEGFRPALAPGVSPEAEPQVTIIKRGGNTFEEYRVNGRLYMVKVTPAHGRPYYLIDDRGDGRFTRQDHLDPGVRVPQWVLFEF